MKIWKVVLSGGAASALVGAALLGSRLSGASHATLSDLVLADPVKNDAHDEAARFKRESDRGELERLKERLAAMDAAQQDAREAASALRFLDGWVAAQNAGDFERYQALYAETFVGIKRVDDATTQFNLSEWLADRKPMFERGAKVSVARVQPLRRDEKVELVFEQRWASSTFADRGSKALVLVKVGDAYRIEREEMLESKLDDAARQGPCTKAYAAIERNEGVRLFADVGSLSTEKPPLDVPIE